MIWEKMRDFTVRFFTNLKAWFVNLEIKGNWFNQRKTIIEQQTIINVMVRNIDKLGHTITTHRLKSNIQKSAVRMQVEKKLNKIVKKLGG